MATELAPTLEILFSYFTPPYNTVIIKFNYMYFLTPFFLLNQLIFRC